MAQIRFHNYQRPVDSFDENRRILGPLQPGRYRGFDGLANISGLTAEIAHNITGIQETNSDNTTQTAATGAWLTNQGVVVQEDANIAALTFVANGSANPRIDVIYGEHDWLASPGGQSAIYGVIQGTPGTTPVAPALSSPVNQVILGYVLIPGSAADLSGATYTAASCPELGGQDFVANHPGLNDIYARLHFANTFDKMNSWAVSPTAPVLAANKLTLATDGNTFDVSTICPGTTNQINKLPVGTRITLFNRNGADDLQITLNAAPAAGFAKITCYRYQILVGSTTFTLSDDSSVMLEMVSATEWAIVSYSDALSVQVQNLAATVSSNTADIAALIAVPVGGIIMWSGTFGDFDITGLGNNPGPMKNWAVCNGNNGTPDLRGRFMLGAIQVPDNAAPALPLGIDPGTPYGGINPANYAMGANALGSSPGQGEPHHKLTIAQIPAHTHGYDNWPNAADVGSGGTSASSNKVQTAQTTSSIGGGENHNNLPPYYALAYLMRVS